MGIFDALGAGAGNRPGGGSLSPIMLGLAGLLAYRTFKGKGRLADMFGGGQSADEAAGGSAGVGNGLKDLLDRFRQDGHDDKVQSWVSTGANKPIAPQELEHSLGEERIQWLVEQTGMSREQLLQGLSSELPRAVDKLTPNGRLPTDEELSHFQ